MIVLKIYNAGEFIVEYIKTTLKKDLSIDNIVSIHYFEYTKDFAYSGEFHDFWELVYVDKESLVITSGAHEMILSAGQFFLHRPMEFHNVRCDGHNAANSVILSFSSSSPMLFSLAGKVFDCPQKCKKFLALIIAEAKNAFISPLGKPHTAQLIRRDNSSFGAEQLIQSYLEEFLIRLIRKYGSNEEPSNTYPLEDISNSRLAEICKYIESNAENRLTFSALCQHFSMSESSLKKLFREGIGSGAMDYYNKCKIDRAKKMIREKNTNFTEIADRLGYNSLQYFSRHFKQSTGMTPSQYAASIENMRF